MADAREQDAQIGEDLGGRAHRRARAAIGEILIDGDRRRQALNAIDLGAARVIDQPQRFEVLALAFLVQRVDGQCRFARPR